ncbi:MAG: hypothetical protein ACLTKH_05085 [Eubacterium sp.]
MELQAVMEKRRSIRNYNPERKVTKEQLRNLLRLRHMHLHGRICRHQDITVFYLKMR